MCYGSCGLSGSHPTAWTNHKTDRSGICLPWNEMSRSWSEDLILLSINLSIYLSIYPSIYLSVYLSLYISDLPISSSRCVQHCLKKCNIKSHLNKVAEINWIGYSARWLGRLSFWIHFCGFNSHWVLVIVETSYLKIDWRKARKRDSAAFDESRRAVGMLNPMRHKSRGMHRGGEKERQPSVTTACRKDCWG